MAGKSKDFAKKAVQDPGYLHRALGIPQNQPIPLAKEQAAAHQTKNPHLEHAAELALAFRHMNPPKKKGK
jgi:hypothetical protein